MVAAKHADVYLTWGEPPAAVAEEDRLDPRAAPRRRAARSAFGIRLHTIARDTREEAWAEADRLLDGITEEQIAKVQDGLARSGSEGQRRMLELNKRQQGRPGDPPQPVGRRRPGPRRRRHRAGRQPLTRSPTSSRSTPRLGIEEFVLSAYPHLEGAYWFGEGVLPELARRGLWEHPAPVVGRASVPFGAAAS